MNSQKNTRATDGEAVAWRVIADAGIWDLLNDDERDVIYTDKRDMPSGDELAGFTVTPLYTHPRATSDEVERDVASLVKSVQKDAQSVFEEYVLANYPDGCVIARASWHAPRLFRAAVYAIDDALAKRGES